MAKRHNNTDWLGLNYTATPKQSPLTATESSEQSDWLRVTCFTCELGGTPLEPHGLRGWGEK